VFEDIGRIEGRNVFATKRNVLFSAGPGVPFIYTAKLKADLADRFAGHESFKIFLTSSSFGRS